MREGYFIKNLDEKDLSSEKTDTLIKELFAIGCMSARFGYGGVAIGAAEDLAKTDNLHENTAARKILGK